VRATGSDREAALAFEPTLYTAIYLSATLIAAAAIALAWKRRSAPGGGPFLLMLISALLWCFFDAVESASIGIPAHVFWAQLAYFGNMPIAVFFFLFTVEYTGRRHLPGWAIGALMAVPAAGLVAAATNGLHQLVWTGFTIVPGGMNLVMYSHGWFAFVISLYALMVAIVGAALLTGFALRSKTPYRRQSLALLGAVLLPLLAEIAYISNPEILPGVDPSVTMALSGALMAVGLVRFRLLDLVPVARERLVENMEHGLLVLDAEHRILDSNPATGRMLGASRDGWTGADVRSALSSWPEMADCLAGLACDDEATLISPSGRSVSVSRVALEERRGHLGGTMVTLRDSTAQAETQAKLQEMNADLHERVLQVEELQEELREQAIRDPLTGLFNRRYLDATLEREIGRAQREGYPVSIVMIDVDFFKRINDEHGHPAGDQVLRFLGAQLRAGLRTGDIACRYGGDEFLMVLPNTRVVSARARAEEWRTAVHDSSVYWMEWREATTLSLGVASFPENGSSDAEVMAAADAALYSAKEGGRNRTVVSDRGSDDPEPTDR
jgi:diguanylate cyclase (GGDEF)-like protein